MKKIIIPRRDHEVYFIPVPKVLGPKQTRSFAAAQMEKLHPGFSVEAALDIKRLVFNKARWVMVTVMEAETLEEYRVLHRGARFFTNTSIAVYRKDFITGGIRTIGDERIGYDHENGSPVSIPLESGVHESRQPEQDGSSRSKALKAVPARCGVFAKKKQAWRVTAMIVCALAPLPLLFFPAAKGADEMAGVPFAVNVPESPPVLKYPPPAIEIISEFSTALVGAGGKITRWRYNESASPLIVIEMRGIDVLSLRNIITQYDYVVLEDISDIRYIDGESQFIVFLNAVRNGYMTPPTGTFFSQNFSLPIFTDLTGEFRRNGISVISETLPSDENGNALYTVTYTAKDRTLTRSMEIIMAITDKYPVRVKVMEISLGGEGSLFTVVCSLSQFDAPRYATRSLGDEKDKIPKAFGYTEPAPPPPVPKAVAALAPVQVQELQAPQTPPSEVSVVGTIRDDRGQTLFYREAGDGKIMKKDTP